MTTRSNDIADFVEETDADRRRAILADNALSLDLVSALAGDRALTDAENDCLNNLKKSRSLRFYSDLFLFDYPSIFCSISG